MNKGGEQGSWRSVRLVAAVAAAATAAILLLPATSLAAAGSLDHSFGDNGRLVIKTARPTNGRTFEVTRLESTPMLSTPGPKGELVVAENRRVLRYRADGRPQKRFGGNGRAAIRAQAGMSFELAGVAVDSRGRVLVAGTTRPVGATGGSQYARVSVYRFRPNGKLDQGFGEGGVAGASLGPMEASGLAVDSHDRPVLTGFSALTPSHCNAALVYLNTTAVVRLTAGGTPDSTFGSSGVFADPLEDPHLPALAPSGKMVYVSAPEQRCAGFVNYGPGGNPVASIISPSGSLSLRFPVIANGSHYNAPTSLAVDRRNRIVILMTSVPPEGGGSNQEVRRLLPDGSLDPEFGPYSPGVVVGPAPPGAHFAAVTTDARNRVVLAGYAVRREGRLLARGFVAARLNAAGKTQTWFGRDGAVKVRFGKRTAATATQVCLDSRGRIVLSGTVETLRLHQPPTKYSLAFARLRSG
jgi:uncharacterized delta-60 repeat protein